MDPAYERAKAQILADPDARWLYLSLNQLTALPPEIGQLTNLLLLYLNKNQLTALPPEICQLTNLERLDLDNNQLNPELEVAYRSGLKELQKYLVRLSREGEPRFEAKLLLVGEGEVGKSSLLATLRDEDWVDKRDSTHGLEIKDLELRHPDKDALNTNIRNGPV